MRALTAVGFISPTELALTSGAVALRSFNGDFAALAYPRDVARDRRRDHLLAVCVYLPPVGKRAVDRVEYEWLQDFCDVLDRGGGERD